MGVISDYLPNPSANPHILVTSRREQPDFIDVKLDLLDDEQSYSMLVQEAEKTPANEEEKSAAREIAAVLSALPLALELAGAYLAHRLIGWCAYRDLLREDLKQALPTKLASLTRHEADLFRTLTVSEREIGEEPLLANVLDMLTWSGLELGKQALEMRYELLGNKHHDVAASLSNLANCYSILGEHTHSLELGKQSLEMLRDLFGDKHANIATTLSNFANYHAELGDNLQALELGKQALEMRCKLFGDKHLGIATSLNNLAGYHSGLGEHTRALELGKQTLGMRRELLGESHPDTINSLQFVAEWLYRNPFTATQGKALVEDFLRHIPRDHPSRAKVLSFLNSRDGFRKQEKIGHSKKRKKKR